MSSNLLGEAILKEVAQVAAETAIKAYKKEQKDSERRKFNRRYHNTKLLLEHYRDFQSYSDKAVYRLYEEIDDDLTEVINLMDGHCVDPDEKIGSIERGVQRTRVIMKHVDKMLEVYRKTCEESPYPEEQRRWRIIRDMYLSDEEWTVKQLADRENIAERTVYKDITAACRRLTALIFGVDGFRRDK